MLLLGVVEEAVFRVILVIVISRAWIVKATILSVLFECTRLKPSEGKRNRANQPMMQSMREQL